MKKTSILVFVSLLLSVSCAYFNTFYNARQYYKKANHETRKNLTGKPTSTENNLYQEAIDRALTVIVRYPNSKYIDDALLLAGKSYYYRQEYFQAKRKFLELSSNYPESPFVPEGKLWMARTQFALDEFEEAESIVNELISQDVSKDIQGQAFYYMGQFHEKKRNFKEAVDAYRNALEYGVGDLKANTLYSLGTSLDTLGRYEEARDAFENVHKSTHLTELIFEGRFRYAQMNKKMGNTKEALKDFQTLLADENYTRNIPNIKVQIADTYFRSGQAGDAVDYYDEITQVHEKSLQAAESFYRMGRIYEMYYHDYDKSLDNYKLVKQTSSRSEYADTAEVYSRDIQRLQALLQVVEMGKKGESGEAFLATGETLDEDTLTLELVYDMMDTTKEDSARYTLLRKMGGKLFADSVFQEKNKTEEERQREIELNLGQEKVVRVDWREWIEKDIMPGYDDLEFEFNRIQRELAKREKPEMADNPQLRTFRVEELDRNLFLLAEMYMFRFDSPDSAFSQYDYLVREFPESPYTPKALYNMAYLYNTNFQNAQQAELIYQTLMKEYGHTLYGNAARKELGFEPVFTENDSLNLIYADAQSVLLDDGLPEQALTLYEKIWSQSVTSDPQPRALYAIGFIYENYLNAPDKAFVIYDSLLTHYPDSKYAIKVLPKLEAVKNKKEPVKGEQLTESSEIASADSVFLPVGNDSTAFAMLESGAAEHNPAEMLVEAQPSDQKNTRENIPREENGTQMKIKINVDLMARQRRAARQMM